MAFLLRLRARGISDVAVMRALEQVPRDQFVPHRYRDLAWRDMALPIACGQTMPEAWLVARMMEALDLSEGQRVLEIGTGSGYATAILAKLAGEVISLELFEALALESATRLATLGASHVRVLQGDALGDLISLGRFDRILVHAVVDGMPGSFAQALRPDGVMVMGRKGTDKSAVLTRLVSDHAGVFEESDICSCRLSPLIGLAKA